MELYRGAAVGLALISTVEEMIKQKKISKALAIKIMEQYDESCVRILHQRVKARPKFSATKLNRYNSSAGIYTLVLTDVQFYEAGLGEFEHFDRVKIVTIPSQSNKMWARPTNI